MTDDVALAETVSNEKGASTLPVIECNKCKSAFNPFRGTPKEWFNSKRCPSCGNEHSAIYVRNNVRDIEADSDESNGVSELKSDDKSLYIMQSDDLVKIGVSQNPERRRKSIQNTSPKADVELVKVWLPRHARQCEADIHDKLMDRNTHGEWFRLDTTQTSDLVDAISLFLSGHELGIEK